MRALWRQFESVKTLNGVLYRLFYDTDGEVLHEQLVLPRELRIPFLELVYNDVAGHLKAVKCIPHVMRRAWWFGRKTDLNLFIKCCHKCESYHRGKTHKHRRLHATHSGFPGEKLAVDLCGPFQASNGYKYILSFACLGTKTQVL